mgnify:CR=1 FL=1
MYLDSLVINWDYVINYINLKCKFWIYHNYCGVVSLVAANHRVPDSIPGCTEICVTFLSAIADLTFHPYDELVSPPNRVKDSHPKTAVSTMGHLARKGFS